MTWAVPAKTVGTLRDKDRGIVVWSLQRSLAHLGQSVAADGSFGPQTLRALTSLQREAGLTADGICGPASQKAIGFRLCQTLDTETQRALVYGLMTGESGCILGAVNHQVPGGTDVGVMQRRLYDPIGQDDLERGFDAPLQVRQTSESLRADRMAFRDMPGVRARTGSERVEYAWRLAVLAHNWPWAADRLAKGELLGSKPAAWVPDGVRFADGTPVVSYADWAAFYAMGSHAHRHAGYMTGGRWGVPSWDVA